jgi:hypothetical protein
MQSLSPISRINRFVAACCLGMGLQWIAFAPRAQAGPTIDLNQYSAANGIQVSTVGTNVLRVTWPVSRRETGEVRLNLATGEPLIRSLGIGANARGIRVIATNLEPVTTLTIGERDARKAAEAFRGMVFFENPRERPHERHPVTLTLNRVTVMSVGTRTTVRLGDAQAGSFRGDLRFTFFSQSPAVLAETVLTTDQPLRAILYDAGLSSRNPSWTDMVWFDPMGALQRAPVDLAGAAQPKRVQFRTLAAEGARGAVAVFPTPHQYFYPLDFADNFGFTWLGKGYSRMPEGYGFGIRQPPEGDRRWVPWVDARAGTEQHLGFFFLIGSGNGEAALREVARFTRNDRFKELRGHHTFTSHYHVEHTVDFLNRQKEQNTTGIPKGLENPGFVKKFKATGVDIVHLAEFHHGWTPGQKAPERLKMLKAMHEECERLSDRDFLLLPGEEPNVHLGGHWMSFFPKPVYWVLNRGANEPFEEQVPEYGTVYRMGSTDDVLKVMQKEKGLMWTAHARIKASEKFPDAYRDQAFYKSDHFLGAAWKAMPSDLSRPTLGWRVLDLLDDMNQWGQRKQILGEVDVFQVQPDYELYAPMNINYLKLDRIPRFADGWQPVLDALRGGQFFTTTGEILVPRCSIGGRESGEVLAADKAGAALLDVQLEWTFPLAFAEVVSGDGTEIRRHRLDLTDTVAFGEKRLRTRVDLSGQKWVRFEVWDVAANGAFTQPVWIE